MIRKTSFNCACFHILHKLARPNLYSIVTYVTAGKEMKLISNIPLSITVSEWSYAWITNSHSGLDHCPFGNDVTSLPAFDLLHCSRPLINRRGDMLNKRRQIQNILGVIKTVPIVNTVQPTQNNRGERKRFKRKEIGQQKSTECFSAFFTLLAKTVVVH